MELNASNIGRVLYVDDEEINLVNFREAIGGHYQVFTAVSGEEALALLAREGQMGLVIADQRMPGMTGIQLLIRVKELHPETTRMIMSAYTEINDLIDAINQAEVFRYCVKPWHEDSLLHTISNAIATYNLAMEIRKVLDHGKSELREQRSFF